MTTENRPAAVPAQNPTMLDRGKLAVLAMFAGALVAASFAWWWNYHRGQRTLDFYGPEAANLIRTAPKVEILLIEVPEASAVAEPATAAESTGERIPGLGPVVRTIDISRAPGLIHARTALLADASYDWNAEATPQAFGPVVRFRDENSQVALIFGLPHGRVIIAGSDNASEQLIKKTADGWIAFLERNIKQADEKPSGLPKK